MEGSNIGKYKIERLIYKKEGTSIFEVTDKFYSKFAIKKYDDDSIRIKERDNLTKIRELLKGDMSRFVTISDSDCHYNVFPLYTANLQEYSEKAVQHSRREDELVKILKHDLIPAIESLHKVQICHGDIKASNILAVSNAFGIQSWVISDFDNSRTFGEKLSGMTYIPPEVRDDLNYTANGAIDMYALGFLIGDFLSKDEFSRIQSDNSKELLFPEPLNRWKRLTISQFKCSKIFLYQSTMELRDVKLENLKHHISRAHTLTRDTVNFGFEGVNQKLDNIEKQIEGMNSFLTDNIGQIKTHLYSFMAESGALFPKNFILVPQLNESDKLFKKIRIHFICEDKNHSHMVEETFYEIGVPNTQAKIYLGVAAAVTAVGLAAVATVTMGGSNALIEMFKKNQETITKGLNMVAPMIGQKIMESQTFKMMKIGESDIEKLANYQQGSEPCLQIIKDLVQNNLNQSGVSFCRDSGLWVCPNHKKAPSESVLWNEVGAALVKQGNYKDAYGWFMKSYNVNCGVGIYHLANLYLNGHGVRYNPKAAFDLFVKSGTIKSKCALGYMYENGVGMPPNIEAALDMYLASESEPYSKERIEFFHQQ
ncbi:hypothetical protein HDV02_002465, partial [Globomyces sp. JEL0801]